MADEVATILVDTKNNGTPYVNIETTAGEGDGEQETPEWQPVLLELQNQFSTLMAELRTEREERLRMQAENQQASSTFQSQLMESNTRLQEAIAAIAERALTQPPPQVAVIEKPPSDTPNPDDGETAPSEVVPVPQEPAKQRPKRRPL